MKLKLAFASVLALSTAACASGTALEALDAMQFLEDNQGAGVSYASRSGSGGNLTLRNVTFRANLPDWESPENGAPPVMPQTDGAAGVDAGTDTPPAPRPMKLQEVAKADSVVFTGLDMRDGKPVFTGMVANSVIPATDLDGTTMKIGSVGIEGMNAATGAFIAGAFTKAGPGEPPPFEQWQFSNASVKGFVLAGEIGGDSGEDSAEDSEPYPTGAIKLEVGELSLSNVKDKIIGLTRLSGIKGEMNVPGEFPIAGTFDLGTMDYTNIRAGLYADIFAAGMGSAAGGEPTDWNKVFASYTSPLESYLDAFTWTGAKADFSGLKVDVSPTSYTTTRDANGVVIATKIPPATFKLTADSQGGNLGAMGMMLLAMGGYPSNVIEIYTQGDATFDPQKDLTRYTGYNIGVADVVDIKVDGGVLGLKQALPTLLAGMMSVVEATSSLAEDAMEEGEDAATDEDGADADPDADADADISGNPLDAIPAEAQGAVMQMVMGLIGLQVTDLDISITDKQLVGLILNQTSSSSGQSVEEFRADLTNMVLGSSVFMTDAGIDAELANEATTAIGAFLGQPGTLRIQLKPKSPIGAMSLMLSPPTKESLGFSATFTPLAPAQPN